MDVEMLKGVQFDVSKIVAYLEEHKGNLEKYWDRRKGNINVNEISNIIECVDFERLNRFEKEIQLKNVIKTKFDEMNKSKSIDDKDYKALCLWIIKDWGGITSSDDEGTMKLVNGFLLTRNNKYDFKRIASTSKIASFMEPTKDTIYDSRVAYSLNWIILSTGAGSKFFPIPSGRNSRMVAFDLNVLIRLKYIDKYIPADIKLLDNKRFINNVDKELYIEEENAYYALKTLIKLINKELWRGDKEREEKLYYTEMLLFIMADFEIYMDIVTRSKNNKLLWQNLDMFNVIY